ncbi:MAG: hypothetical protein OFPII_41300 [Osedax symbiont Rs1]|nr:MAG: hypothetical protein OFPII_41300 [Osedax symbiont Rs1]
MTSLHHIAQTRDFTAVRKIPTVPVGPLRLFNCTVKPISYSQYHFATMDSDDR